MFQCGEYLSPFDDTAYNFWVRSSMLLRSEGFKGSKRALVAAVLLALGACSERAPTAPGDGDRRISGAPAAAAATDRVRRPTPRVIDPRGGGLPLPAGIWGGEQAELISTEKGATVRLFCSHGAADPILAGGGRFSVPGWLVREGGPVPIDDSPFRRPALYVGVIEGETLTLTVFAGNDSFGPFTLVHGRKSTLGPCPIV